MTSWSDEAERGSKNETKDGRGMKCQDKRTRLDKKGSWKKRDRMKDGEKKRK